jgi:hypothetical protein
MDSLTGSYELGLTTPDVAAVAERSADTEAVLRGAVDAARTAVIEFSGDTVGEYLGVAFEDVTAATHRFLANLPGYQGWQWAVVVATYPGSDHATISEVVLVPGPTALVAPEWVPWDERVKPGDLNPGDLLAPPMGDPRLVPGYLASGDPEMDDIAIEIGLGRRQVLSAWGRAEAAQRWHDGDFGPTSAMARATRRVCVDCGFFLPLAGSLGAMFGVCGNEMAADGRVVDFRYGCGAHSDTPAPAGIGSPLYEPYDDGVIDLTEPRAEAAVEIEFEVPDETELDLLVQTEGQSDVPDETEFEVPVETEFEVPAETDTPLETSEDAPDAVTEEPAEKTDEPAS